MLIGWVAGAAILWLVFRSGQAVRAAPPAQRLRVFCKKFGILGGGYLGIIIVLSLLENSLIFRPTTHRQDWVNPAIVKSEDVWLSASDGNRIHGLWCPVEQPDWVVIYCHGNAGNLSHRYGAIHSGWQRTVNSSVFIFDYPGYGRSPGKPNEANCYTACAAIYEWLIDEKKIDSDKIVLFGSSLGGGVASELAMRKPHHALILLAAFTNIPDMAQRMFPFLPTRWIVKSQFNNLERVKEYKGNLMIAHGTSDMTVPFEHGQRLFEAANPDAYTRFLPISGAGHNDWVGELFFVEAKKFLSESQNRGGVLVTNPVATPSDSNVPASDQ